MQYIPHDANTFLLVTDRQSFLAPCVHEVNDFVQKNLDCEIVSFQIVQDFDMKNQDFQVVALLRRTRLFLNGVMFTGNSAIKEQYTIDAS
jgi:hypothetical protein